MSEQMLGIDIGNSTIAFGIFISGELRTKFKLPSNTFDPKKNLDQDLESAFETVLSTDWRIKFSPEKIFLSSVVPELNPVLLSTLKSFFDIEIQLVSSQMKSKVKLAVDHPAKLGADRISNANGALVHYGVPSINIDIGTAVTIDYLNSDAQLIGGAIIPGPLTAIKSLGHFGAQLPKVKLTETPAVIGTDTTSAIQSGIYWGWIDLCQGICARMQKEHGKVDKIVLTGGLSETFAPSFTLPVELDPNLTLKGLYILSEIND